MCNIYKTINLDVCATHNILIPFVFSVWMEWFFWIFWTKLLFFGGSAKCVTQPPKTRTLSSASCLDWFGVVWCMHLTWLTDFKCWEGHCQFIYRPTRKGCFFAGQHAAALIGGGGHCIYIYSGIYIYIHVNVGEIVAYAKLHPGVSSEPRELWQRNENNIFHYRLRDKTKL